MRPAARALLFFLLAALPIPALHAQSPIGTFACSGAGQPSLSMPAYAFDFAAESYLPGSEVQFAYALVSPSQVPALLSLVASKAVYSTCSITVATTTLTLTQVTAAYVAFDEYGGGLISTQPGAYGFIELVDEPALPLVAGSSLAALPQRSPDALSLKLHALMAQRQAARAKAAALAHPSVHPLLEGPR